MTSPDVVGLIGVTILIVTYAMLQFDKIDPKGFWYSFNNMVVAILHQYSRHHRTAAAACDSRYQRLFH